MSTFANIQTSVRQLVIDLPPTVQQSIPRLVNNAIRSIQRKYNFTAMEGEDQIITTPGPPFSTRNIARFKEYQDKGPFLYRSQSKGSKLAVGLFSEINTVLQTTQVDSPQFLISSLDGSTNIMTFYVIPYTDSNSDFDDGNYRIIIPYYSYTADLVNDDDTNWFTNNADDYIIYKAVGEAFGLDWDYNSMALWLQRAEEKFKEVKLADKYRRLGAIDTLVPNWEGANQPQDRR